MNINSPESEQASETGRKRSIFSLIFSPWLIFIVILGATAYFFLNPGRQEEESTRDKAERPPVSVELAPVSRVTLMDTVKGIGTLQSIQHVEIKPEISGKITRINFQEGELVKSGELLFEIESQKQQKQLDSNRAALEEARSRLQNLKRNHQRFARLYKQGIISENEMDRVQTDMESAAAEVKRLSAHVELAREDISDASVLAPLTGYISNRMVDKGSVISPGQVLATMYQTDPLEITFNIPEKYMAGVAPGQTVLAEVSAYPDKRFQGKVTFISPTVNESTRTLELKAAIDNPVNKLRPGAFAAAMLILGYRENTLVVPEESLVAVRDGYVVFAADPDSMTVEMKPVETGLRRPGLVEIIRGLEAGEKVVSTGHMNLGPGASIRVNREKDPDWAEKALDDLPKPAIPRQSNEPEDMQGEPR
ncbi:MAG: efflux RND transporter periplasmic adaptor subunit [Desulfonatronovibrionaceae bacterium]